MNKKELIDVVAAKTGLTKKETGCAIDAVFEEISMSMKKGDSVALFGFGTFKTTNRAARNGVNPKTKAKINIAARKSPGFHAGKTLKELVNSK